MFPTGSKDGPSKQPEDRAGYDGKYKGMEKRPEPENIFRSTSPDEGDHDAAA